ncbi:hypothetical protein KQX54_019871 [Cotesia glomerata]|uniref:Uncharacterized protein n=1 Tax=Cotesia glomerata TaxID=32391 RepID=A0AAV7I0S5_COTGL|nr:hypothetical protein KQX54_019871 [Cotesia glomerata]
MKILERDDLSNISRVIVEGDECHALTLEPLHRKRREIKGVTRKICWSEGLRTRKRSGVWSSVCRLQFTFTAMSLLLGIIEWKPPTFFRLTHQVSSHPPDPCLLCKISSFLPFYRILFTFLPRSWSRSLVEGNKPSDRDTSIRKLLFAREPMPQRTKHPEIYRGYTRQLPDTQQSL